MKSKKLGLDALKVKSFVTDTNIVDGNTIKGGKMRKSSYDHGDTTSCVATIEVYNTACAWG